MTYGDLTLICGPMYAGKTTELLRRILWARNGESKTVLVVKPAFDDRYSTTKIVSHDGLSSPAKAITSWDQVEHLIDDSEVVCFDEVQFFIPPHVDGDLVSIVSELLARGKTVVANGLDTDWQGRPFATTAALAAMADEIIKLSAHCFVCGRPARKTFKKVENDATMELGSSDLYEARCNQHWVKRE